MCANPVDRVKGVHDYVPDQAAAARALQTHWLALFAAWGYRQIELPILEHAELYLRKSGSDILAKTYAFTFQNRRLALRPEMTASAIRAYVEHLRNMALPLRLAYAGPVFRYERPQESRYRQFTQVGVELVGASGPMADAEVLALACHSLERIGLKDYRVVLGHIGLLQALLRGLALDERAQDFVLGSLELLNKEGKAAVQTRLEAWYPTTDAPAEKVEPLDAAAVGHLSNLLDLIAPEVRGGRTRRDILDGLAKKLQRDDLGARIRRALAFVEELAPLRGEPSAVLKAARTLLERWRLDVTLLAELDRTIQLLDAHGVAASRVVMDLGLSRGLRYYNGIIFEIYPAGAENARQLCGGGRYDDLATALGASQVPACGFAFGLERVRAALAAAQHTAAPSAPRVEVLVIAVSEAEHAAAIRISSELRAHDLRTELAVRPRGVKGHLHYADRSGIPFVVVVGADEAQNDYVTVRAMKQQRETRVPRADLAHVLRGEQWSP